MSEILELMRRGDRRKNPEVNRYRRITLAEAKLLRYGQRVYILDRNGRVAEAKVNGQPKTWKRDASRIEIPMKYGLYEYFTLTARDYDDILILED